MLSPSPPYHHQGHCAKAIKESKRISGVMQNPRERNASQQGAPVHTKTHTHTHTHTHTKEEEDLKLQIAVICFSMIRFSLRFEITMQAVAYYSRVNHKTDSRRDVFDDHLFLLYSRDASQTRVCDAFKNKAFFFFRVFS